ncbi:MAG: type II toxin-antitoxin system HicA family toxin [Alphaproteobacteria bacterium]|nr:type II toxin-antitoxin system HicA family toxin [Alphaproteobacteria bacterium]
MNNRHRKTLSAVFANPVPRTLEWKEIESLLIAAGARLIEGRGSRVRFEKDGEIETFHRPHPSREAKRYQVSAARSFLLRIGVSPCPER